MENNEGTRGGAVIHDDYCYDDDVCCVCSEPPLGTVWCMVACCISHFHVVSIRDDEPSEPSKLELICPTVDDKTISAVILYVIQSHMDQRPNMDKLKD